MDFTTEEKQFLMAVLQKIDPAELMTLSVSIRQKLIASMQVAAVLEEKEG